MNNAIKIVLAILFFLCLADMPYGYYQFVRFAASCSFIYFALNRKNDDTVKYVYIFLALLFQPFIKIALGRTNWNIVDVVVAGFLIMSVIRDSYNSDNITER